MYNSPKETDQRSKAILLKELHLAPKLLVLPNIWDPLGAALLQHLGYQAIATASAAVACTNGHDDGEKMPFDEVLQQLRKIVGSVDVPVTADIESGYSLHPKEFEINVEQLIQTGIAGLNIEDTNLQNQTLLPIEAQCTRIRTIRKVANKLGVPIFINVRVDVLLHNKTADMDTKMQDILTRSKAYIDAGADAIFPIFLNEQEAIQQLVDTIQAPISILVVPGIPELSTLQEMGVARVSLGPGFLNIAMQAMKDLASDLLKLEGLGKIQGNTVSFGYLKTLVNK